MSAAAGRLQDMLFATALFAKGIAKKLAIFLIADSGANKFRPAKLAAFCSKSQCCLNKKLEQRAALIHHKKNMIIRQRTTTKDDHASNLATIYELNTVCCNMQSLGHRSVFVVVCKQNNQSFIL